MFFSRWPIFKIALSLAVIGLALNFLPSRMGNERMADDFAQMGLLVMGGQSDQAIDAFSRAYMPFLVRGYGEEGTTMASSRPAPTQQKAVSRSGREVRIRASNDSHFYVSPRINGRPLDFVIDTGATSVAIRYEDALKAGLKITPSDFTLEVRTANGTARFAPIIIERIELEGIVVRYVRGAVGPRGALSDNLLGMSFLRELSDVRFNGNEILLVE